MPHTNIEDYLHDTIWSGLYTEQDIENIISGFNSKNPELLQQFAIEQFQRKKYQESTWPAITDCDKLDAAFRELCQFGIFSFHIRGYEETGIMQSAEIEKSQGRPYQGSCHYDLDAVAEALRSHRMHLQYCLYALEDEEDEADEEISKQFACYICSILSKHGLNAAYSWWNCGYIEIPNFLWQRRARPMSPGDFVV